MPTSQSSRRVPPRRALLLSVLILLLLYSMMLFTIGLTHQRQPALPLGFSFHQSSTLPSAAPNLGMPVSSSQTITNASQALIRISQYDVNQYKSSGDRDTWWMSDCSSAAITEAVNSYGHHYHIGDILAIQRELGVIDTTNGLLYSSGIDKTAARLGFDTITLNLTLDQIIQIAQIHPVIISFPPHDKSVQAPQWITGHILIVRGGDAATVRLADSSNINLQVVSRSYFLTYWRGFAKLLVPMQSSYSVLGKPTITAAFINQVLAAYHSPAAGKGQALYKDGVDSGIDPVFALAFFMHESGFGTAGEARITLALGNLRCIPSRPCINTTGTACQQGQSCYAKFYSWEDGFLAWYQLIHDLYVADWGRTTVDQIIPKYAPGADNNDEQGYINALKHEVDAWRFGIVQP